MTLPRFSKAVEQIKDQGIGIRLLTAVPKIRGSMFVAQRLKPQSFRDAYRHG